MQRESRERATVLSATKLRRDGRGILVTHENAPGQAGFSAPQHN